MGQIYPRIAKYIPEYKSFIVGHEQGIITIYPIEYGG